MGMIFLNGKEYTSSPKDGFPPIIYSDEEREIGVWRDGKPLYEKTISKNNIRIENAVQFNHNIANLGICVRAFVFMYDSSTGVSYNFEAGADSGVNNQSIGVRVYPNYIYFQGGQDFSASTNRTWYFTLQYTKITDTAGSGKYTTYGGIAHHYSTSEQVIGTWIDGKPLYEKTYSLTSPSSTSTENLVSLASLSVKHVIRIDATIFQTNNDATDSTNFFKVWYSSNNGNIRCSIIDSGYCSRDMVVTIQYTKTTD